MPSSTLSNQSSQNLFSDRPTQANAETQGAVMAVLASDVANDVVDGVVVNNDHADVMKALDTEFEDHTLVTFQGNSTFRVHRKLGEGTRGHVYAVCNPKNGQTFALKAIPKLGNSTMGLIHDVETLEQLKHPNIIQYHGHFKHVVQGAVFFCLKLDYCEKGTVRQLITGHQELNASLSLSKVCKLLYQVADALAYVHQQGSLHGDVCSDNILLTSEKAVKLTGFGNSSRCPRMPGTMGTITGGCRINAPPEWMHSVAPLRPLRPLEVPLPSYDMWGLGCVMVELATLKLIQQRLPDTQALAFYGGTLGGVENEMGSVHQGRLGPLSRSLLAQDPDGRPAAPQVRDELAALTALPPRQWANLLRRKLSFGVGFKETVSIRA